MVALFFGGGRGVAGIDWLQHMSAELDLLHLLHKRAGKGTENGRIDEDIPQVLELPHEHNLQKKICCYISDKHSHLKIRTDIFFYSGFNESKTFLPDKIKELDSNCTQPNLQGQFL